MSDVSLDQKLADFEGEFKRLCNLVTPAILDERKALSLPTDRDMRIDANFSALSHAGYEPINDTIYVSAFNFALRDNAMRSTLTTA